MVIIVTGTPGTGKTTYAKKLAQEKGYTYLDLTEFVKRKNLSSEFDKARDTMVVDVDDLLSALLPYAVANPQSVIDGHLSHELPKELVERCYVTKCNLKELKRRLEARNYSEAKVRENLDAEIFDICLHEAQEHEHNIEIYWSSEK